MSDKKVVSLNKNKDLIIKKDATKIIFQTVDMMVVGEKCESKTGGANVPSQIAGGSKTIQVTQSMIDFQMQGISSNKDLVPFPPSMRVMFSESFTEGIGELDGPTEKEAYDDTRNILRDMMLSPDKYGIRVTVEVIGK